MNVQTFVHSTVLGSILIFHNCKFYVIAALSSKKSQVVNDRLPHHRLRLQSYYSMSTLARHVSDNLLLFLFFNNTYVLIGQMFFSPFWIKWKMFLSPLLLYTHWWRHRCLCGLSLRQHSSQKVAALELNGGPRIAELTLASCHCHITLGFAPVA